MDVQFVLLFVIFLSLAFGEDARLIDLRSPFRKIVLVKNENGVIEKKIIKEIRHIDKNFEGVSPEGVILVVDENRVVAVLPACPEKGEKTSSQEIKQAIEYLDQIPESLKQYAGITNKDKLMWNSSLQEALAFEEKNRLENKKAEERDRQDSREKINKEKGLWLDEADDFMKPRSEGEIESLKKRGEDLLKKLDNNPMEIRDRLAFVSQFVPKEQGGPLPGIDKLTSSFPEISVDEKIFYITSLIYLISLFMLLIGLSSLGNIFTYFRSKAWPRVLLSATMVPLCLFGLFSIWWPSDHGGKWIEPIDSETYKKMDVYLKNRATPYVYFPSKTFAMSADDFVRGILVRIIPSDNLSGILKGKMGEGKLYVASNTWEWSQPIHVLGIPFGIVYQFSGPITGLEKWSSPAITVVKIGQIQLPESLARVLSEFMVTSFQEAIRTISLHGVDFKTQSKGLIEIMIPASGIRPEINVDTKKEEISSKPLLASTFKKEVAIEDLVKNIDSYMGRYVLVDGYVVGVDSGGEFSGDSKTVTTLGNKQVANKPSAQIGLDRYDKFYMQGGVVCWIKSNDVFAEDDKGDIYIGPRANSINDIPLIKKGQRVRFLKEGIVERNNDTAYPILIRGILVRDSSDIQCYDPNQQIDFQPLNVVSVGDGDIILVAHASSNLPITFESSDPSVAEIYKGERLKIKKPGKTIITAIQAGNSSWVKAVTSQPLIVEPSK